MKTSLVIATSDRLSLLRWQVVSLRKQPLKDTTVVVVDDGSGYDGTREFCSAEGLGYLYTGSSKQTTWRPPVVAFNVGVRASVGDVVVLSSAEMFHLNDTMACLVGPFRKGHNVLSIPDGKDDDGRFLKALSVGEGVEGLYCDLPELNTRLPFLLAVRRDIFLAIGGFDEAFAGGCDFDDNDLVLRLQMAGCNYCQTNARCVHLVHGRQASRRNKNASERNAQIFRERRHLLVRNS